MVYAVSLTQIYRKEEYNIRKILEKPYFPQEAKNVKLSIVDSIMGGGKTTAALQKINQGYGLRFIYVTPYLPEVDRVIENTRDFYQPKELGEGKLESLHDLLCNGKNIACTHALFLRATKETRQLIYYGKYILILDEALEVLHDYNSVVPVNKQVNDKTVKWLIETDSLAVDENFNARWCGKEETGFQLSELVELSERQVLRCVRNNLYVEYDSEIFRAFQRIYVLTYLFNGSMLDSYFRMHNFSYDLLSANSIGGGKYEFSEYSNEFQIKYHFAELINIYDGKYNDFQRTNPFAYSIKWLKKQSSEGITQIKKNMRNYRNSVNATSGDVMWTTSISGGAKDKLMQKGFRYTKRLSADEKTLADKELRKLCQFVPCNIRATNDFSDRHTLMYILNRYLNPNLKDYFAVRGYVLDEDQFALSELLQWIWRSAIRKGERINLYVPSTRMRNLLQNWLGIEDT